MCVCADGASGSPGFLAWQCHDCGVRYNDSRIEMLLVQIVQRRSMGFQVQVWLLYGVWSCAIMCAVSAVGGVCSVRGMFTASAVLRFLYSAHYVALAVSCRICTAQSVGM